MLRSAPCLSEAKRARARIGSVSRYILLNWFALMHAYKFNYLFDCLELLRAVVSPTVYPQKPLGV